MNYMWRPRRTRLQVTDPSFVVALNLAPGQHQAANGRVSVAAGQVNESGIYWEDHPPHGGVHRWPAAAAAAVSAANELIKVMMSHRALHAAKRDTLRLLSPFHAPDVTIFPLHQQQRLFLIAISTYFCSLLSRGRQVYISIGSVV